jgi:hypothetical protein
MVGSKKITMAGNGERWAVARVIIITNKLVVIATQMQIN